MSYPLANRDRGLPVKSLEKATREGRYEGEGLRVRKDGTQFLANTFLDTHNPPLFALEKFWNVS
jgi:hypothetical protein